MRFARRRVKRSENAPEKPIRVVDREVDSKPEQRRQRRRRTQELHEILLRRHDRVATRRSASDVAQIGRAEHVVIGKQERHAHLLGPCRREEIEESLGPGDAGHPDDFTSTKARDGLERGVAADVRDQARRDLPKPENRAAAGGRMLVGGHDHVGPGQSRYSFAEGPGR